MDYGLKGRVVAVTGGASGIGRATALALARDGADVGVIDLDSAAIDNVLEEIRAFGGRAAGMAMDVRDADATERAASHFERELGPVDGLFACAGISRTAPAEAMSAEDFSTVMGINVNGVFLSCQAFGRRMIDRGRGAIVIVSSVDGLGGHPGRIHYAASKHAVSGMAKTLALEWGRFGVRVNAIAPGLVDTPLLRANMPANFMNDIAHQRTPLGRLGAAEEMAAVGLMLLSDAASYVTGAVVPVDGGLTAGHFTRKQGGDFASNALLAAGVYTE